MGAGGRRRVRAAPYHSYVGLRAGQLAEFVNYMARDPDAVKAPVEIAAGAWMMLADGFLVVMAVRDGSVHSGMEGSRRWPAIVSAAEAFDLQVVPKEKATLGVAWWQFLSALLGIYDRP
jgi:hypothetical protein